MPPSTRPFDLFISFHWRDRLEVERLAAALRERGLKVFIDRWYLQPGRPWQEALEQHLSEARAVAVMLGAEGMGPWQQREVSLALDRQAHEPGLAVIPVLIAPVDPPLGFLSLNTWVDLRDRIDDPAAVEALAAAARGEPPPLPAAPPLQLRARVCPYRGLRAFREEDAPFFFGRDTFVERLDSALRRHSFVAVVGPSGSGKSSVVRAGLVPRLRRGTGGAVWEVAGLTPGDRPLRSLAAALLPPGEGDAWEASAAIGRRASSLAAGDTLLRDIVEGALAAQPGTDRLLLVVDQWEEVYTLCKDAKERGRFITQLLQAAETERCRVVLTVRADFYARVLETAAALGRLEIDWEGLGRDQRAFLGPVDPEHLLAALDDPATGHAERARIGVRLDSLGDPRPGVGLRADGVPDIAWCEVPGGEVLLELETPSGLGRLLRGSSARANRFAVQPFHIACYALTYAQYRAFLEADDGYRDEAWWEELRGPFKDPDRQTNRRGNHPAEGMVWYEAVAYCRWLSARLGYEVRLPTEWEWQQAATGGAPDHVYPWGPEWLEGLANTAEAGPNRSTAVGMYPRGGSPVGALDMAGNVFEWCLNEYGHPSRTGLGGKGLRVMRGGSWVVGPYGARGAFRARGNPGDRGSDLGFRLVCSSPI